MTKLKTLKDLEYTVNVKRVMEQPDYTVSLDVRENIKQEAIKWIKAFEKGECHTDFAADGRNGQENIIEWIIYFYNITEKDLKNG